MRHKDVSYLVCFLFEKLPDSPRFGRPVYVLSAAFFASIALIPLHAEFLFAAVALAVINLIVNTFWGRLLFQYFEDFSHLAAMLNVVGKLGAIESPESPMELEALRELAKQPGGWAEGSPGFVWTRAGRTI